MLYVQLYYILLCSVPFSLNSINWREFYINTQKQPILFLICILFHGSLTLSSIDGYLDCLQSFFYYKQIYTKSSCLGIILHICNTPVMYSCK